MLITVAGAGAGKTSGLAEKIISSRIELPKDKNIYCIAFTNNAAYCIRKKLQEYYGEIPYNIKVATIHSFLYEEIIKPYYFALYGKHYKGISIVKLSEKPEYRNSLVSKLEAKGLLHIEKIPERAKWIVSKKSTDKKTDFNKRNIILNIFNKYCGKIYVDEAQDINSDIKEILMALDKIGVCVELYGDPKQDLHGYGSFRNLIEKFEDDVKYLPTCHRCPAKHLVISNSLIDSKEHQCSEKVGGHLSIIFETDLKEFDVTDFDLSYIYHRNDRFETQVPKDGDVRFQTLLYETKTVLETLGGISEIEIEIKAYSYTTEMLRLKSTSNNVSNIINYFVNKTRPLSKIEYAKLAGVLNAADDEEKSKTYQVNSIESIKGLEGNNCLFVLTTDLAPYLFKEKCQSNKIKNALYVALTRSLDSLTILVSYEVEKQYSRDKFKNYFNASLNE